MLSMKKLAVACVVGMCSSAVLAGTTTLGTSGWDMAWAGEGVLITLDGQTSSSVTISIEKTLDAVGQGEVPSAVVTFIQTEPNAVGQIILASEKVHNNSWPLIWAGYRWILSPTQNVAFDPLASAWNHPPFTGEMWDPGLNWLAVAEGGEVLPGGTFEPFGRLVIDVDTQGGAVVFALKQVVIPGGMIPEPTSLALVGLGAAVLLRRSRRRRA